ncbi:molybdopterin converting factor subunit 1 [Pseudomonas fluorescens]|uniref:molybdopterin converting factor subunit 1 n=1 Tax=Pseudomonas fluorescens TaxID=294 RepID=UPI001BE8B77F|nr:molybdopterin converting factor subunit 1 [Pseudomonas fluorescens]MBT2372682.1 molybdopterin converting factor subunit 1 [Pseudomonas fluorescens]
MILLNYFARYREQLGVDGEKMPLEASLRCVDDVRQQLIARGGIWADIFSETGLMCAVNQELCKLDAPVEDFDEIAFFPPVTGG